MESILWRQLCLDDRQRRTGLPPYVVTGRLLGGGMIEICSGLKAGERVATAGQAMLNEGDTVATQAVANRKGGMQQ